MIDLKSDIVVPSINAVKLTHKQIFPEEGVSKNVIRFVREEDMIVMCLSLFVHDYVHDYNLGSMHARVIKGNITRTAPTIPSLFEILGINIENKIFKIIAYPVGGHRDISMYNDAQYEDIDKDDPLFTNFYGYLNSNEALISSMAGGEKYETPLSLDTFTPTGKLITPTVELTIDVNKDKNKEQVLLFEEQVKPDLAEGIIKDTPVKTIAFNDVKDTLFVPSVINSLNIEQIISTFEKNADFLDFHSALNTYVINYLGYEELEEEKDKNKITDKAIKSSLKYIINDLKDIKKSMYVNFYGDIFSLLLASYEIIMKKIGDKNPNPFDILNSSEMLYQFILFYITYITVENYDEFDKLINQMKGGAGPDDEAEDSDDEESVVDVDVGKKAEDDVPILETGSPLLPVGQKQIEEIPEYVFITHNNLLTTITRGMFIKLGIWKRIFFPDKSIEDITPEDYKFGPDELNSISYDKLVELFPITPETGGHRNNELLILEILILKRLLVEMSPSKTLTFGAKIDDDLKNYMDAFYLNNYIIKKPSQHDSEIDPNITNNPDFIDSETENLFSTCQEGCSDPEFDNSEPEPEGYGSDETEGGMRVDETEGGMRAEDREALRAMRQFEESEKRKKEEENLSTISPPSDESETSVSSVETIQLNPDIDIIEQKRPPSIPVLFNKMKKMYQNNMLTITQLQSSKIESVGPAKNLYDLLKLNQVLMHKKDQKVNVNIPAPKYKFVINNAANVGSNINGSRMFIPRSFSDPIADALAEIQKEVFNDETVNEEKLSVFVTKLEKDLEQKYIELETNYENEERELNRKKRAKEMTIREYNRLLKLKHDQKVFERTVIVPLENKLFLLEVLKENRPFYDDFEKNFFTWFRDSQPMFGLYRSLQRGTFCPTSSMMDAMDNCSLKYNTTEPKEVGTSYSEIVYNGLDGKNISFGGVVLNYNTTVNGEEELTAKLHYTLGCNVGASQRPDIMTLSTMGIKVSESNDLKARVAYKGVINMIRKIYDSIEEVSEDSGVGYIQEMWRRMQYQYYPNKFNELLSATALKTMGDYLQECQACFKWGGYVSNTDAFPDAFPDDLEMLEEIKDKLIYRSVSEGGRIIPYDKTTGNGLRLGIQGDRPSGFRSIYMLLNGEGDVNDQAITGYMFTSSTQNPSRSLLVARNSNEMREPNINGLKGSVIYVTRELQIPDRDELLRSLEFLNIKEKNRKVDGEFVYPEIVDSTIAGSEEVIGKLSVNPMSKITPLKNSAYEDQLDYDVRFDPLQPQVEVDHETTDAEEARAQRKENKKMKGLSPAEKNRIAAEKKAEKERIAAEIKSARKLINELFYENPEQKQSKKLASIFFEFLDQLKTEKKIPEDIDPEIFDIIYEKALEDKRIEDAAAEKAKMAAETRERNKREKEEKERKEEELRKIYMESEEGQKKIQEIKELESQIVGLENKIKEITKQKKLKRGEKLPEMESIQVLENKINGINEKIESDLATKMMGGKIKSRINRKKHIHKITKRGKKIKNKLTKRHKKIKKSKRTRKLVS